MTYPPQGNPAIEGDFSVWSLQWEINVAAWGVAGNFELQRLLIHEVQNKLTAITDGLQHAVANLTTGAIITLLADNNSDVWQGYNPSSHNRYSAYTTLTLAVITLHINKDGSEIQSINLTTLVGWNAGSVYTALSKDGKYILLYGSTTKDIALLKGA